MTENEGTEKAVFEQKCEDEEVRTEISGEEHYKRRKQALYKVPGKFQDRPEDQGEGRRREIGRTGDESQRRLWEPAQPALYELWLFHISGLLSMIRFLF